MMPVKRRSAFFFLVIAAVCIAVLPARAASLPIDQFELGNGLQVVLRPAQGTGTVTFGLAVRVGQEIETTPETYGLNFWTAAIMYQDALGRESTRNLIGRIELYGGVLSVEPHNTYTLWYGKTGSAFLDAVSKVLADEVQNPRFDPRYCNVIMRYAGFLAGQLELTDQSRGFENLLSGVFGDHPYGHRNTGNRRSVSQTTWPGLQNLYRAYYTPNNSFLFVSGDFDPVKARRLIERDFGSWKWRLPPARPVSEKIFTVKRDFESSAEGKQAQVFVGFQVPGIKNQDGPALAVLSAVMGEGLSSRLFQEIRSRDGLAYECFSQYDWLEYGDPSLLYMYVLTSPHKVKSVIDSLLGQVRRFTDFPLTQDELQRGQAVAIGRLSRMLEEGSGQVRTMAAMMAAGMGYDGLELFSARVRAVSAEDVQRVAAKYLQEAVVSTVKP